MRVLVTGAGGYIGSVLTRYLLEEGHHVRGVDRFFFGRQALPPEDDRLEVLTEDIRWLDKSALGGIDAVIDLAALSNDPAGELDAGKTWEINHAGRVRVAQLARAMNVRRYVLPSSCSIYGFQDGVLDETSPGNPLTTYAQANLRAESDVLSLATEQFLVVVLRQATVFGLSPRMRFDLAINGMVRGFFKGGTIPILRDGTQWRPFVHIKDTVRAMRLVLDAPAPLIGGQIFNVGSDEQNVQIMPLARMVAEAMGVPFAYEWYGLPDHRSYRVSFHKIRDRLGFRTRYTPQDGAREIYEELRRGDVDPDDPKTITVQWYKHLIETHPTLLESREPEGSPR
ncbi:MAG: SDR family oxidoreductase [Bacillati bacterium ANGP1]|uniref:SDR family oxidoreductase n=1 Tax=Candidatus Segetimicrobium genomatis TaxID=2569760 RepID=A0A537JGV8_9BACT|nr:MAG: SDR family oxidoreductase [Terrabacteria group bacterium ANGP1]